MTAEAQILARDYAPAFLAYLSRPDEKGLAAAYELGRRAMRTEVGLLAVVRVHSQLLLEVLESARDVEEARQLAENASTFLVEALASFEMTQRGFMAGEAMTSQER